MFVIWICYEIPVCPYEKRYIIRHMKFLGSWLLSRDGKQGAGCEWIVTTGPRLLPEESNKEDQKIAYCFITCAINIKFKQVPHKAKKLGEAEEGKKRKVFQNWQTKVSQSRLSSFLYLWPLALQVFPFIPSEGLCGILDKNRNLKFDTFRSKVSHLLFPSQVTSDDSPIVNFTSSEMRRSPSLSSHRANIRKQMESVTWSLSWVHNDRCHRQHPLSINDLWRPTFKRPSAGTLLNCIFN